jgi:transposase
MKAYSTDIRSKVLEAYQRGEGSQRELAARFDVSLTFVRDLLKLYRETGSVEPRHSYSQNHKPSKVDQESVDLLMRLLLAQPSLSLKQLCEQLARERNLRVSRATLWRALAKKRKLNSTITTSPSSLHHQDHQTALHPRIVHRAR